MNGSGVGMKLVIGLGEDVRYTDESKDILKSILKENVSTASDGGVGEFVTLLPIKVS